MRVLTEIFKTVIWFPWAILELLSGNLPPDARRLLTMSVGMTSGLFLIVCVMVKVVLVDPMGLESFPWLFALEVWLLGQLIMGIFTRAMGRRILILN